MSRGKGGAQVRVVTHLAPATFMRCDLKNVVRRSAFARIGSRPGGPGGRLGQLPRHRSFLKVMAATSLLEGGACSMPRHHGGKRAGVTRVRPQLALAPGLLSGQGLEL